MTCRACDREKEIIAWQEEKRIRAHRKAKERLLKTIEKKNFRRMWLLIYREHENVDLTYNSKRFPADNVRKLYRDAVMALICDIDHNNRQYILPQTLLHIVVAYL